MAQFNAAVSRRSGKTLIPAAVTIAGWRLRQTWRLLAMTGFGIAAAVVLICTVPLFSQVAMTAGLRRTLTAAPDDSLITVSVTTQHPGADLINRAQQQIDPVIRQSLGAYLAGAPSINLTTPDFAMAAGKNNTALSGTMSLFGAETDQVAPHAIVAHGRLPQAIGSGLEVAVAQATASELHLHIGSSLILGMPSISDPALVDISHGITLHVVGIFAVATANDPFWGGDNFQPAENPATGITGYEALASRDAVLAALAALPSDALQNAIQKGQPPILHWNYQIDPEKISAADIDYLSRQPSQLQNRLHNALSGVSDIYDVTIGGQALFALTEFSQRAAFVQIPVTILLLQILALVLFFVSIMAELLVERQADAIAVLRSRGASRRHIFGALVTQSIGLGVIALVAGPLVAIALVSFIAGHLLPSTDQNALNILTGNPLAVAWNVRWYAFIAVICAVAAMIIAISRAASLDILTARREAARATRRPVWQRLNLDIVVAIIGLTCYGAYVYVSNNVDPAVVSGLTTLSLIAPIFLLVASAQIFVRIFPALIHLGALGAARSRGATAMVALAQMARAPRQSLRTTLLLALTIAFTIFALIFTASQFQRNYDVAAYQVGADFAGNLPPVTSAAAPPLADQTAAYQHIPGVVAASLGYSVNLSPNDDQAGVPVNLLAVDADTFPTTALWTAGDSRQPLSDLMASLAARRQSALTADAVPVYVDAAAAAHLTLAANAHFSLNVPGFSGGGMHFVVAGIVQHIPTVFDEASSNSFFFGGNSTGGGILADFQTFAAVYAQDLTGVTLPPNYAWLRTAGDSASLASVRAALGRGELRLAPLLDRRSIIDNALHDPLQIDLTGVLQIGAITALLLALIGALIASWVSARSRQVNFAILRALGTAPPQLAGVLLWEQGIIYGTAITLGVALGVILIAVVLPAMVFTGLFEGQGFVTILNVPPVQIVWPAVTLGLVIGGMIAVCIVAIALMTRIATQPSIGQTLRLNED